MFEVGDKFRMPYTESPNQPVDDRYKVGDRVELRCWGPVNGLMNCECIETNGSYCYLTIVSILVDEK